MKAHQKKGYLDMADLSLGKTSVAMDTNKLDGQIDREAFLSQFGDQASWWQTFQNAWTITRRELVDSFRDWRIIIPIFMLTLVFPLLANLGTTGFTSYVARYSDNSTEITNTFLPVMPLVVGFFPISISLVIALESFVGEQERRSLEPLLATPLTNLELYIGKTLASVIPPILASYTGLFIYITFLILGPSGWRPEIAQIIQILLITTIQAVFMVTGAVVISSQTTSTRAANLLASLIVIPMSMITVIEATIILQPDRRYLLWWVALFVAFITGMLMWGGVKNFNRERLLGRAIDFLEFGTVVQMIWHRFLALTPEELKELRTSHALPNPWAWWKRSMRLNLHVLRKPVRFVLILWLIAFLLSLAGGLFSNEDFTSLASEGQTGQEWWEARWTNKASPIYFDDSVYTMLRIVNVTLFASVLTAGFMPLMLMLFAIAQPGFTLGLALANGINPLPWLFASLVDGILILPLYGVAGAMAIRLGISPFRPQEGMGRMQFWLTTIGDTARVFVSLLVPLIFLASLVDSTLTPVLRDIATDIWL
jgi:ABC-type transport system involved in multi-copper enzyme maturation permease subunit